MKAVVRAKDSNSSARNPGSRPHSLGAFEAKNGRDYPERNLRNLWSIPTAAFSEAHFATFPPALVRPCILAGTSQRGNCSKCATPFVRVKRKETALGWRPTCKCGGKKLKWPKLPPKIPKTACDEAKALHAASVVIIWEQRLALLAKYRTLKTTPAVVFDPFGGAGTTALVAEELGRNAILTELNPAYARMARKRIREHLGRVESDITEDKPDDLPLFGTSVIERPEFVREQADKTARMRAAIDAAVEAAE